MGTVINPNGKSWFATASGVTVIGTTKTYQTYADLLREQYPGKLAWVVDASGDPSVDKGSALYAWRSLSKTWEKIYETEMMDGGSSVIQNFVGWVATPEQLRAMYPNASDGWYAIIGTTDSIWVWDSDTNDWKDTTAMHGEIMWSQIVDPPSSYPITFITGLREDLDSRVLNTTLETFYPKKADLATVASTGSYTDLTNLPDIDGIITKLDTLSGSVEEARLQLTQLSDYVNQLSTDQIKGMDQYQKTSDTISWDRITGFPTDQYATRTYVDQNFSKIGHTHSQYALNTEVQSLYATKVQLSTELTNLTSIYAPIKHTHTMDEIIGYVDNTPTFMQFVRPVEQENMFLKVEIFSDPSMETLVKEVDSRTESGRLTMSYYNGLAYVAFPENGVPVDGQGRLTAVNVGRIEAAGQVYVRSTWQNATASVSITSATMYPAFTPSDMIAVGNFWRTL
nr:MAG TPA: hypothetical protein [Bacteriophage sp.]